MESEARQSRHGLSIEILRKIASYGVAREMMRVNWTWNAVASSMLHWNFTKPEDFESLLFSSGESKSLLSPVGSIKVSNPIDDSHIKFLPASLRLLDCSLFCHSVAVSLRQLSHSCPGLSELTIEIKSRSSSEGESTAPSMPVLNLDDLAPLASLQGLSKLSLSGIDVTSTNFSALVAHPHLRSVTLRDGMLSKQAADVLVSIPQLKVLDVKDLEPEAARRLGDCNQLRKVIVLSPNGEALAELVTALSDHVRLDLGHLPAEWKNGTTNDIAASLLNAWRACELREWRFPQTDPLSGPVFRQMLSAGLPEGSQTNVALCVEGSGGAFEAESTRPGRPKELALDWRNPRDSDMIWLARQTPDCLTTLKVDGRRSSEDPRISLDANGLAALGEVRTLRELSLRHVDLSGDDGLRTIEKLLDRCPLKKLQVLYSPLPPGAIDYVLRRGHETLHSLIFWGSTPPFQDTPDAVRIGQFPQLEYLNFSEGSWTHGLRGLDPSHLPRLESVHITGCPIGVADLQALASLPSLKSVSLDGGELGDEVCRILANAPALEKLTLYECNVSADALHEIAQNQNIHDLDLQQVTLDFDAATALGALPGCESLWFGELQLASGEDASAVLTALAQSKSMKRLDLHFDSNQEIPASACTALARMPSLRDLKLRGTLTSEAVEELSKVRWLDWLEIGDCTFTDDCSAALDKLCAHRGIHFLDVRPE
jgi:hypothetical protein